MKSKMQSPTSAECTDITYMYVYTTGQPRQVRDRRVCLERHGLVLSQGQPACDCVIDDSGPQQGTIQTCMNRALYRSHSKLYFHRSPTTTASTTAKYWRRPTTRGGSQFVDWLTGIVVEWAHRFDVHSHIRQCHLLSAARRTGICV